MIVSCYLGLFSQLINEWYCRAHSCKSERTILKTQWWIMLQPQIHLHIYHVAFLPFAGASSPHIYLFFAASCLNRFCCWPPTWLSFWGQVALLGCLATINSEVYLEQGNHAEVALLLIEHFLVDLPTMSKCIYELQKLHPDAYYYNKGLQNHHPHTILQKRMATS